MKILMVLTSHDKLGDTGRKTGFWLEEFAAPYFTFLDAGAAVTLASPKGGQPPIDPVSDTPEGQTDSTRRFKGDPAAQAALASTTPLADVAADGYDAVFYPGGHGPMWDLAEDPRSIALIEAFWDAGKPVAAVCHAPGVLRRVQSPGPAAGEGQAGDGLHQWRGGGGPPDQGRAVPRGGRAEAARRALREGGGLGELRRHRREARHRPEPGLVPGGGRGSAAVAGLRGAESRSSRGGSDLVLGFSAAHRNQNPV